jgi:hypothetical protein
MYDCRHATLLIEKRQEVPLTLKERLHLAIHLFGCSICKLYQRQSRVLGQAMRVMFRRSTEEQATLGDDIKREMQEKINQRLGK